VTSGAGEFTGCREQLQKRGETLLAGALVCVCCGYAYGDQFFEWLKDNWDAFL
jgi:hypothetical protein